jgi:LacI family transcriptional regulator
MSARPSLRDLARSLGLSHTTVSEALRGGPRVHPKTRDRILAAAAEAGYQHNPLAGALMSEMRRSRTGTFRGSLAILDLDGPRSRPKASNRFHRALALGATQGAADLGFKAELINLAETESLSLQRLDAILHARAIRGIFLLPTKEPTTILDLDWSKYAGIYSDYIIDQPPLHTICSNHYRSMLLALDRIQELGYRRPGLVLRKAHDERLLYRWKAAFSTCRNHHASFDPAPTLMVPLLQNEAFAARFTEVAPDVVLCHDAEVMEWMTTVPKFPIRMASAA